MPLPLSDHIRNFHHYNSEFKGADLLLGNGFSMAFWPDFSYSSLFDKFKEFLETEDISFFDAFQTSNFEAIQAKLQGTEEVNQLLSLPIEPVTSKREALQRGLIDAIRSVHPRPGEIADRRIEVAVKSLAGFGDIFTLNYDLITYNIVMRARDLWDGMESRPEPGRVSPYNDYFWAQLDSRLLEFRDFQNYGFYKHVYYLHGALFLFRGHPTDTKIKSRMGSQLLGSIASEISIGRSPLFVSEGHWQKKADAINHSPYLRFAHEKFKNSKKDLVVFGASLSEEQDLHIIESIKDRNCSIAYAIYVGNRNEEDLLREIHATSAKFPRQELLFVDSATVLNLM